MRIVILLILTLITSNALLSQQNNFRAYSVESGLPQSNVYCIIQDNRGYLWLGTDGGGLCRFDGKTFNVFAKKNGLSGNVVRAIFQDKKGNIWIGTDNGINIYNGYDFIVIDTTMGLCKGTVLNFFEDSKQNMWVASDNGLNKIHITNNTPEIETITTNDGLLTNFIFDVKEDSMGRLWLAMYGGINIISFDEKGKIKKVDQLYKDNGLSSDIITCIEKDKNNNFWFGTYDAGIIKIDPQKQNSTKFYNQNNGFAGTTVWDIMQDSYGNMWFGTDKAGIFRLVDSKFINYSEKNGLPNNQILKIFEDREKNIWFGTMGNGLVRFLGEHFSHYRKTDGLLNEQVTGIIEDKKNNLWISTLGNGIIKADFENDIPVFTGYTTKNGLTDNNVNSIYVDNADNLWISTQNGLSVLNTESFINITEKDGLVDNRVSCVYVDSKDIVWIGTGAGLSIYNNGTFFNMTKGDKYNMANDQIQTIIESNDSSIWIGTLGGLIRFKNGQMTQYDEEEGLDFKTIHAIIEDKTGNIIIGTFGDGIYRLHNVKKDSVIIRKIAGDDILGSANIYSLIFQEDSILIAGTDKGFDKIFFDKNMKIVKVRNYDITDGFSGVENKQNAIYKDKNNNIWFGTVNGLTKYSPSKEKINKEIPDIHITGLDLFYDNIDWKTKTDSLMPWFNVPENPCLSYNDNHLTFRFSAISLTNPYKTKYKYMLEGVDNDWSPVRTDNEVVYSGLAPGNYTFKIIAANENNRWSKTPYEYHFEIKPPFWKTTWFIISMVIAIIILIYIYIKLREKKLKHEKAILEQKVAERTREIAEKNKILKKANEEILEQKEVIEEKNKDIMDSIRYAKRIQEALLPPENYIKTFLENSFVLFKPKDIVSGDFYWMHHENNKTYFAAIDCTGHGVPGAFMSIVGHNGLNQTIIEKKIEEPAKILDNLNKIVSTTLNQKSSDTHIRDGMDMVLCCIDYNTNTLEFAGANNPLYLIRNKELLETKGDKQPIGAYNDETLNPFTNHKIKLQKNDFIVIFSDGYADQFGGDAGKKFKYKSFKNLILKNYDKPVDVQKKIYDKTIEDWKGDLEQIDDILVIGVKI